MLLYRILFFNIGTPCLMHQFDETCKSIIVTNNTSNNLYLYWLITESIVLKVCTVANFLELVCLIELIKKYIFFIMICKVIINLRFESYVIVYLKRNISEAYRDSAARKSTLPPLLWHLAWRCNLLLFNIRETRNWFFNTNKQNQFQNMRMTIRIEKQTSWNPPTKLA